MIINGHLHCASIQGDGGRCWHRRQCLRGLCIGKTEVSLAAYYWKWHLRALFASAILLCFVVDISVERWMKEFFDIECAILPRFCLVLVDRLDINVLEETIVVDCVRIPERSVWRLSVLEMLRSGQGADFYLSLLPLDVLQIVRCSSSQFE